MKSDPPPRVAVLITTRNRKDNLRISLASCLSQSIQTAVVVIDDGSIDGTTEMVRSEFPTVDLHPKEQSLGLICRRNEAAKLTDAEILFSMDDDAEFSSPKVLEETLQEFDHLKIAAIAIPCLEPKHSRPLVPHSLNDGGIWVTNEFRGTAYAIRRDLFLAVGGYRECLFHQGEEGDLCIRLLDAGYFVRVGSAEPIIHHESSQRSFERMNVYGQRNLILFAWMNVPYLFLIPHLLATIVKGLSWGARRGFLRYRLRGAAKALGEIASGNIVRKPVRLRTYRLYRKLKKKGPYPLSAILTA